MGEDVREVISSARQFVSIAPFINGLIFGSLTILIALGAFPLNTWVLMVSGGQLLGASFITGIKLRGFLTPEIKNIPCPNCDGYFTTTSLVCFKCKTTMDIPRP